MSAQPIKPKLWTPETLAEQPEVDLLSNANQRSRARKERRTFWELMRKYKIDLEKIKLEGSIDRGKFAPID